MNAKNKTLLSQNLKSFSTKNVKNIAKMTVFVFDNINLHQTFIEYVLKIVDTTEITANYGTFIDFIVFLGYFYT